MRLTRKEESELLTHGILALLSCIILGIATFWIIYAQVESLRDESRQTKITNESLLESNRRDGKEIRFLRDNAKTIEAKWATYKGWGDGVRPGSINPLVEAGVASMTELPASKLPQNPTEYSGLRLTGDKTEFQRLVKALAEIEAQQGLLQVRSASLTLPGEVRPNSLKPTFLEIQLELVAPASR